VKDQNQWKEINIGDALVTGGEEGQAVENIGRTPLVLMAVVLVY
jgi:hypothetical protein